MHLFTEENYQVFINPELRTIPVVRRIIERDKDRNKRTALSELAYIYFMYDPKSAYNDQSRSEAFTKITAQLGLGDYKEDAEMQAAVKWYKDLRQSTATKTLQSIKEGLRSATKAIDVLNERINQQMKGVSGDEDDDEDNPATDMESLMENVNRLIKLSIDVPKALDSITKLEEQVKKEAAGDSRIKGGGVKGQFED